MLISDLRIYSRVIPSRGNRFYWSVYCADEVCSECRRLEAIYWYSVTQILLISSFPEKRSCWVQSKCFTNSCSTNKDPPPPEDINEATIVRFLSFNAFNDHSKRCRYNWLPWRWLKFAKVILDWLPGVIKWPQLRIWFKQLGDIIINLQSYILILIHKNNNF